MKSILFASTALVAFAGAAAAQSTVVGNSDRSAEITIQGEAEMGIVRFEGLSPVRDPLTNVLTGFSSSDTTSFHTDVDVQFKMRGTTDSGLTFGADVDLDENNAFGNTTQGGETIFISGTFGTLTMGDTDGALDWALTELDYGGSIADDHTAHTGWNGNAGLDGLFDGQIARYDYTFGAFGVAISAELDDSDAAGNNDVFGIGAKYTFDFAGGSASIGAGIQDAELAGTDVGAAGLSLTGTFGGFSAGLNYMHFENHIPGLTSALNIAANDDDDAQAGRILTPGLDTDFVGIAAAYSTGAITVAANYGVYDFDGGGEADGFGLSATYDLGGGAAVQFGYGHSDIDGAGDFDTVSLGVKMNF